MIKKFFNLKYLTKLRTFSYHQIKYFCNLNRLNFDKIKIENDVSLINDVQEKFSIEDNIIEYRNDTNWQETVLNSEIPVIIEVYAQWCNPCKKLNPIIIKKLEEEKSFKLVKINIDDNQDLAESLKISSIPAVFLVYKGNMIDSFVGMPTTSVIDQFFENVKILRGISNDEKVIQSLLAGADEWMNKKQYINAESMLVEASSHKKWKDKYGQIIKLGLAICAFRKGEMNNVEIYLKELKQMSTKSSDNIVNKKIAMLEIKLMLSKNPDLRLKQTADINREIENNPSDLNWRYQLALLKFENNEYEDAINTLLDMIIIDRNWNTKAAQNLLIYIFNYLGSDDKLTIEGRKQLFKIIY